MTRVLTPSLISTSCTLVKRVRELPVRGRIHVEKGDSVSHDTVVASAELQGDLIILRVPEKMGLEPFEVIESLWVKEAQEVKKGDVICERLGLFGFLRSTFHAPYSGVIELITESTGHIGLRLPSRKLSLNAYISGKVVSVDVGKSVTIETQAALVQGIFGIGGENQGVLKALKVERNQIVTSDSVPEDSKGKILFGGMLPDISAIKKAAAFGASAFVTGSISGEVLREYLGYDIGIALTGNEEIPMSLIVTEGFGKLPFSEKAYSVLKNFEGASAAINGTTQVRAGAVRPEIIISHDKPLLLQHETVAGLEIGSSIRIIRAPYFGEIATITELPVEMQRIESGTLIRVLQARLSNGELVTVPRANVEVV